MNTKPVTLGIDIGGTNTVFSFVDAEGNCFGTTSIPTNGHQPPEVLLKRLHDAIEHSFADLKAQFHLIGIGIGAPNANYYKGTVEYPPHLDWEVVPLMDMMKQYYPLPIAMTNDANAAAIGEKIYGAAKDMKDFIVITLGTGLGSGIFVNNQVVYGSNGIAGELGHTTAFPDGRLCECGKKGCLETYASATGICTTVKLFLENNMADVQSSLRSIPSDQLTSKQIAVAADNGDPVAQAAFQFTGRILGMKLADFIVFSAPEAIFLFGGLVKSGHLIFEPTQKYMEAFLPQVFKNKVKLLPSGLQNKNIAVLGAAALILNEIRD